MVTLQDCWPMTESQLTDYWLYMPYTTLGFIFANSASWVLYKNLTPDKINFDHDKNVTCTCTCA